MISPHPTPQSARRRHVRRAGRAAVALATAALLLAPATAGAGTQTTVTMVGRGWGHGIGMCQYGAYGYAKHGWKYAAIIKHYYTGVTLGTIGNPYIRVRLTSGQSAVSITAGAKFTAVCGSRTLPIAGGATAKVTYDAGNYKLAVGSQSWTFAGPIVFKPGSAKLKLINKNENGWVGRYRGTLRLIHYTGGLTVVNRLTLERYLYGVVPHESPASWPIEELKAQAVAARSYAVRSLGKAGAFDVYCTPSSQVYDGFDGESPSSNTAVDKTAHIVPKYNGSPISAYFFSTSGGHTENVENVWGGSPVPYLKGVSDPYDTASPYHIWPDNPIRRSAATVASQLGAYSSSHTWGVKGVLRSIYVVKRGTSPRVVKALVIGSNGVSTISGAYLRVDLGLRDTWVAFTTMSITPSTSTRKVITYGDSTTITGRLYPALPTGGTVTLHSRPVGGSWSTSQATTSRHSQTISGYTVHWTEYQKSVSPKHAAEYYFTTAVGLSPHTTINVRPAVTIAASTTTPKTGEKVAFTGKVTPAAGGKTVWLQVKTASGWDDVASTTEAADGTYRVEWTAALGTSLLRLRVPKGDGLVEGVSDSIQIQATATAPTATPSPSISSPIPGALSPRPSPIPSLPR